MSCIVPVVGPGSIASNLFSSNLLSFMQLTRKVVLELEEMELMAHSGVVGNVDVIRKKERQAYTAMYFKQDK